MRSPDWTEFRSASEDPCGPCCLLERSFDLSNLPRNYVWVLGWAPENFPPHPEAAEISAQVKSYSREYLIERAQRIQEKQEQAAKKAEQFRKLEAQKRREDMAIMQQRGFDSAAIKQEIAAGPLQQAKSLMQTAGQMITSGVTDPKARLAICAECPFLGSDKRCGRCGCFTPAKAAVKKASCPIGLW